MKPHVMPIPVDSDIDTLIRKAAEDSGLKLADIMRQGLRHGVPVFLDRLRIASAQCAPKCLDYLDDYPKSSVPANGYKAALKAKLAKKYDRSNR